MLIRPIDLPTSHFSRNLFFQGLEFLGGHFGHTNAFFPQRKRTLINANRDFQKSFGTKMVDTSY